MNQSPGTFLYLAWVYLVPNATWASTATTVAGRSNGQSGSGSGYLDGPSSHFVSTDNILYVTDQRNDRVVRVDLDSMTLLSDIGSGPGSSMNQFNSPNDIYVVNNSVYVLDTTNDRVQKWTTAGTSPSTVLSSLRKCFYIFVDMYFGIYVSLPDDNEVLRYPAGSSSSSLMAGTGTAGSTSSRLSGPYGIFVDDDFNLFVADRQNHRIQQWQYGASSGTTVAGDGTQGSGLSRLDRPTAVSLDANGFMYICDAGNSRVMRWKPYDYYGKCIAACSGSSGTSSSQLDFPAQVGFDTNGSLYVTDLSNNRIQKFNVLYNPSNTHLESLYSCDHIFLALR